MKRQLIALALIIMTIGCAKQELTGAIAVSSADTTVNSFDESANDSENSFQYYFEKARWGDGDAYLKLAKIYRDGIINKPDFIGMIQMGFMAQEFCAIKTMDELMEGVSDDSDIKIMFDAQKILEHLDSEEQMDSLKKMADTLVGRGVADGFFIQAVIASKEGETEYALALLEQGIAGGSVISELGKKIRLQGEESEPELFLSIADKFPLAYHLLGDHYAKIPNDSTDDIPLAAMYYRKADENACLSGIGAKWLLEAINSKRITPIDSVEVERLLSLEQNWINDSVIYIP